nr:DUF6153 family protein [Actinomadura sp. RB99]
MRRQPGRLRRLSMLPFGLLLLFGVLAMHGVQASPSPSDMSGVPLTSVGAVHDAVPAHSMALHDAPGKDMPGDHHQEHPGGQVCLAILAILFLLCFVAVLLGRDSLAVVSRALARVRALLVGRPPPRPSLHRLSVLRL